MNKFIIILVLSAIPTAFAMNDQPSHKHVSEKDILHCKQKIAKYRRGVDTYPNSEYKKYKLRKYLKKCIPVFAHSAEDEKKLAEQEFTRIKTQQAIQLRKKATRLIK